MDTARQSDGEANVSRRENRIDGMAHAELTRGIIGVCFEVANELGHGFLESVYQRALAIALRAKALRAETEVPLQVHFRGQVVGEFLADLVVEGKVLVELKAVRALAPEHQAQVINYLKATGLDVGLLVNFGAPRLEYRRCYRPGSGGGRLRGGV